jgi:hypothetical protein
MTKVQTSYKLSRTLGDRDFESVSRLTSVYGIFSAKIGSSLDTLRVEYDASRLTPSQLQAVIEQHGLPIKVAVV